MLDEVFEKLERINIFSINIFGNEIQIGNTVLVMWIVIVALIVFAFFATRKLSYDKPGKFQALIELFVSTINNLCKSSIGHLGSKFVPYIGSLIMFLALSNIIAMFNFFPGVHLYPPTKDINVTGALAMVSIIVVLFATFRYKGFKGWAKSLIEPMPVMAPFKIMEYITKPLSLCLRLFGNVLACFLIMETIHAFVPILAAPFSAYFDVFDGILQAFIFVYLTSLYIGEAVE